MSDLLIKVNKCSLILFGIFLMVVFSLGGDKKPKPDQDYESGVLILIDSIGQVIGSVVGMDRGGREVTAKTVIEGIETYIWADPDGILPTLEPYFESEDCSGQAYMINTNRAFGSGFVDGGLVFYQMAGTTEVPLIMKSSLLYHPRRCRKVYPSPISRSVQPLHPVTILDYFIPPFKVAAVKK